MKNNTKNYIIGGVVLLLIVLTISVSYAYFHARILGNDKALENSFKVGKLELSFVDDNYISLLNVKPGSSDSKTFSVENTSTLDDPITYNIKLSEITNNFVRRDLKYTLEEYPDASFETPKEGGLKVEGYINTDSVQNNEMYLAVNIPGPVKGAKQYYKLTIDFQELNMPQDYNQNASFEGKVNVDSEEDMNLYVQEPNAPELYQGMIPVYFNDGKIYIANVDAKWYDYDNNEWANAVLINYTDPTTKAKFYDGDKLKINQEVSEDDILQMYVWIPRYRYKLFNAEGQTGVEKQLIDIEFEKDTETTGNVSCTTASTGKETCVNAKNGNWYTHPAFTFGNTELKGIWIGKFESSDPTDENGRTNTTINEITILPNRTSMIRKSVYTMFNASRDIELKYAGKYNLNSNQIDTHMMKNMEWGAVVYLTQSIYGIYKDEKTCNIEEMNFEDCEVWINNTAQGAGQEASFIYRYGGTATGCVGTKVNDVADYNPSDDGTPAICPIDRKWNKNGVKASTTGNMYGIYDMSGGAWEYIMAVMTIEKNATEPYYNTSEFTSDNIPNSKYYDLYEFGVSFSTHDRGHLGDATSETLSNFGKGSGGWNNDYSYMPRAGDIINPWFRRGGYYAEPTPSGIFSFFPNSGGTSDHSSFRAVLSAA